MSSLTRLILRKKYCIFYSVCCVNGSRHVLDLECCVVLVAFKKSISIFQLQSPLLGQYYWFCFYFTSLAVVCFLSYFLHVSLFSNQMKCWDLSSPFRFWGKGTVERENQENLFQNYSIKWDVWFRESFCVCGTTTLLQATTFCVCVNIIYESV